METDSRPTAREFVHASRPRADPCSNGSAQQDVPALRIEPLGLAGIYCQIPRSRRMTALVLKLLRDLSAGRCSWSY